MSYDNDVTETLRRARQSQINRICKSFSENPYDKEDRDYIEEAENVDLEKGVYKDNPENRKLNRVGQQYGRREGEDESSNGNLSSLAQKQDSNKLRQVSENKDAPYNVRNSAKKELEKRNNSSSVEKNDFNIHDAIEDSLKGTHNDSNIFRERLFNIFKKSGYKNVRKFINKEASDNMDAGEAYRARVYIEDRVDGRSKEQSIDTMKNSWKGLTGDDWNDPDAKDKTKKAFDEDEDYIEESEDVDLEKGVYKDNYKNRKLGRVGQQFGGRKEEQNNGISGSKFFDTYDKIINDHSDLLGSVDRYIERHKLGLDNGKTQEEDFDKLSPLHKEALTKLMSTAYKRFKNKSEEGRDNHGSRTTEEGSSKMSGSKFWDTWFEISDENKFDLLKPMENYMDRHNMSFDNGKTQIEDFDKLSTSHKEVLTKLMNTAYKKFKNKTEDSKNKSNARKAIDLDEKDGIEKDEKIDIEKSQLFDSISDYNNSIKFEKTGKEVKDQITNIVLPAKLADLKIEEANANTLLEDCGDKPARNVEQYWLEGLDISVPYFIYDYDELRECPSDNESVSNSITPPTINYASNSDEITARRNYNDTVRQICSQIVDIVACNTILKNLKDNVKLSLTPRQMVAFQFDK